MKTFRSLLMSAALTSVTSAAKHLVLVEVDFPRSLQLPEATEKQNDELAKKFQLRGYPPVLIASASSTKKGKLGYVEGGPEALNKALKNADKGRGRRCTVVSRSESRLHNSQKSAAIAANDSIPCLTPHGRGPLRMFPPH